MEALHVWLLPWGTWFDVMSIDSLFFEMVLKRVCDEFRPIITAQIKRTAVFNDKLIENLNHIRSPIASPWANTEALSRILIYNAQYSQALPINGLVTHKVPTPNFVWLTGTQALD